MTETDSPAPDPAPETEKVFRKLLVLLSKDGQFYYVAQNSQGENLYTSETYTRRDDAVQAVRYEHEGRSDRFEYVLEYEAADGTKVRETL